jgi:hypothetical protein
MKIKKKFYKLLVKILQHICRPKKIPNSESQVENCGKQEKLTIPDKEVCCRSDVQRADLNWRVAPLSLTFLQINGSSSWSWSCWCMVSCSSWSALALGCAGACVLPNIGHFKHGRVLVGGLHHFLRLALLGAAFVVSSTLQKITMLSEPKKCTFSSTSTPPSVCNTQIVHDD